MPARFDAVEVLHHAQLTALLSMLQLMLTRARAGPLQEADLPAGVLLSTVVDSPVARCDATASMLTYIHSPSSMCITQLSSPRNCNADAAQSPLDTLPAMCLLSCSLYHSLSNVFCPMLKLEQPGSSSSATAVQAGKQQPVDPQLGELLLDVQAGLAKAVRGTAAAGDSIQVCASAVTGTSVQTKAVLCCSMHAVAACT